MVTVIRHWADGHDLAEAAAVTVPADLDVRRAALHIQFAAERRFGVPATLHNATVAAALVEFYGCLPADVPQDAYGLSWREPGVVDLYWHREFRWTGDEGISEDPMLRREGLDAYIERMGVYSD